ncbi:hypothetical protein VSWAT3_10476 [Vibrionales bacterium SWAT-3]|nr:hypothetical protein VSWAT3_10476 [Vibrionales bacterium SWAT-3]
MVIEKIKIEGLLLVIEIVLLTFFICANDEPQMRAQADFLKPIDVRQRTVGE